MLPSLMSVRQSLACFEVTQSRFETIDGPGGDEAIPDRTAQPESPPAGPADDHRPGFAIVGIGASAGGLEALEAFLAHVPLPPASSHARPPWLSTSIRLWAMHPSASTTPERASP